MIELITVMPEESESHARGHKHPFIVSELFSSECNQILDMFFVANGLLEKLFGYLQSNSRAPILDGYFSKLASSLVAKNPNGVLEFLVERQMVPILTNSLSTKSISDLVLKVLLTDVPGFMDLKKNLLSQILENLKSQKEISIHHSKYLLLELIARQPDYPFIKDFILFMTSGSGLKALLESVESENETSITSGLEVLKQIILSSLKDELFKPLKASDEDAIIYEDDEPSELGKSLINLFPGLVARLQRKTEGFIGTTKKNIQILGQDRLKISEFFLCLAKLGNNEFMQEMRKNLVFETLTNIFIEFELNSFFHQIYENLFAVLLDHYANDDQVLQDLIQKSKILEFLSNGCETKAFAGHAVKIGTTILKLKARNNEFSTFIEDNEEWKIFYFEFYAKKSEIERKTLGETRSKVSDDNSSDDSGHAIDSKNDFDAFFSKLEKKNDEDDFDKDEPEADSEPLDMEDLRSGNNGEENKIFGESFGRSGKNRYGDEGIVEMVLKDVKGVDVEMGNCVSDQEYWRF